MKDARNLHGDIVVNSLKALRGRPSGGSWRVFSGQGSMETLPGQLRRPDVGVNRGRCDPDGFKAAEPDLVLDVLSPGDQDFNTFEKLAEYEAVESLNHVVYVDSDAPMLAHWTRDENRAWTRQDHLGLDASVRLPSLGIALALRDIHDGVTFSKRTRGG